MGALCVRAVRSLKSFPSRTDGEFRDHGLVRENPDRDSFPLAIGSAIWRQVPLDLRTASATLPGIQPVIAGSGQLQNVSREAVGLFLIGAFKVFHSIQPQTSRRCGAVCFLASNS
jgi:hypothetical protein